MVTGLAEARSIGIFDGMLPSMFQLGFRQHVIISGSAVVGSDVGEAETKPVLELDLSADKTDVNKAIAQVVITEEMARLSPISQQIVDTVLRKAVVAAVDQPFLQILLATTSLVQALAMC
jgi:hypothetical protein